MQLSVGTVMLLARPYEVCGNLIRSEAKVPNPASVGRTLLPTLIHFHFLLHVFREEAGAGFGFGVASLFVRLDVGFFIDGAAIATVAGGGGNRRCGSDEQKG